MVMRDLVKVVTMVCIPLGEYCGARAIVGVRWEGMDTYVYGRCPKHYAEDLEAIYRPQDRDHRLADSIVIEYTDEQVAEWILSGVDVWWKYRYGDPT